MKVSGCVGLLFPSVDRDVANSPKPHLRDTAQYRALIICKFRVVFVLQFCSSSFVLKFLLYVNTRHNSYT
jgi:hypothetical protein